MKPFDKANAAKDKHATRGAEPSPVRKGAKTWSIRIEQRLPHRIGLPLGSSGSGSA